MKIEDLLLKKEELPIVGDTCFMIPIHPRLLDPSIKIDERVVYIMTFYEDLHNFIFQFFDKFLNLWKRFSFLWNSHRFLDNISFCLKILIPSN